MMHALDPTSSVDVYPQVDHRQPEVQSDLLAWGKWILEETGATGFRVDAMKHYDWKFLRSFVCRPRASQFRHWLISLQLDKTKKAAKMNDLFVVSEFWSGEYVTRFYRTAFLANNPDVSIEILEPYVDHLRGQVS